VSEIRVWLNRPQPPGEQTQPFPIAALERLEHAELRLGRIQQIVEAARVSEWPHGVDPNELLEDLEQALTYRPR